MPSATPDRFHVRPVQYRDLDGICTLAELAGVDPAPFERLRHWFGALRLLSWFPNPARHELTLYVAEVDDKLVGAIDVAPFNKQRSTWRVECMLLAPGFATEAGSALLRHCLETIWEARTWVVEVDASDQHSLGLYRRNGFQPLAQLTDWAIAPAQLASLIPAESQLPNLLPASNADAHLLYQLDTVSMPPLLRQVFDRHVEDFKVGILEAVGRQVRQWTGSMETARGYVFETQRKAAIGYFRLEICRDSSQPHAATLTVHPAYTWLYPELLAQMARAAQTAPPQTLALASADYQPEREAYLEQLEAERVGRAVLMSRSVWHKLREAKPTAALDRLQLSGVLQGLQPRRAPNPSRLPWLEQPPLDRTETESGDSDALGGQQ